MTLPIPDTFRHPCDKCGKPANLKTCDGAILGLPFPVFLCPDCAPKPESLLDGIPNVTPEVRALLKKYGLEE